MDQAWCIVMLEPLGMNQAWCIVMLEPLGMNQAWCIVMLEPLGMNQAQKKEKRLWGSKLALLLTPR
jgi:hypothetical protein